MIEKIKDNYNSWARQYDVNINPTRDLDKIVQLNFCLKYIFQMYWN